MYSSCHFDFDRFYNISAQKSKEKESPAIEGLYIKIWRSYIRPQNIVFLWSVLETTDPFAMDSDYADHDSAKEKILSANFSTLSDLSLLLVYDSGLKANVNQVR